MQVFLYIFTHNILPIYFIVSLGYLLNKKFDLNIYTLTKLNLYVITPSFAFVQLYSTHIPVQMLKVLAFGLLLVLLNYTVGAVVSHIRRFDVSMENAFKNSLMFYNSGNMGIPLITLVFSSKPFIVNGAAPYLNTALTTQILIFVVQNITTNTLGFYNAGRGSMTWKESVKSVLKMPAAYAVPLAFLFKLVPYDLSKFPLWPSLTYLKNAMIAMALLTLGVQLSKSKLNFKKLDVYLSNSLRLIGGPIIAFVLIKLIGFQGITAQALLISSSVPTAVMTTLIAVERNNQPEFASQTVFTCTLLSSITLSIVVYVSRIIFPLV